VTVTSDAISVWRLSEGDAAVAADVLTSAFLADPFFVYAIPDDDRRLALLPPFFAACVRYGIRYGEAIGAGRRARTLEGVAWWYTYPEAYFNHERTAAVGFGSVAELLGEGSDRITAFSGFVDRLVEPKLPEPRMNLDQLGVLPNARGLGIGSALLRQAIECARADNHSIALWTVTGNALRLYEQLGFGIVASGLYGNEAVQWWALHRPRD
jgi:GNAT superfamily N-acetyltransferase